VEQEEGIIRSIKRKKPRLLGRLLVSRSRLSASLMRGLYCHFSINHLLTFIFIPIFNSLKHSLENKNPCQPSKTIAAPHALFLVPKRGAQVMGFPVDIERLVSVMLNWGRVHGHQHSCGLSSQGIPLTTLSTVKLPG
jgi:hypothetical protein